MLDVCVEVGHEAVEEGGEGWGGGGEGLEGVEVFFYSLMLLSVFICQLQAFFSEMFLHCGIHCQLFTDGVASQGPGELISPFCLVFEGCGRANVVSVEVEGFVIGADGFGDGLGISGRHDVEVLKLFGTVMVFY